MVIFIDILQQVFTTTIILDRPRYRLSNIDTLLQKGTNISMRSPCGVALSPAATSGLFVLCYSATPGKR